MVQNSLDPTNMLVRVFCLVTCAWVARAASTGLASAYLRSDYLFNINANRWLKVHSTPSNWKDAALKCHYEGAILASPIHDGTQKALLSILTKNPLMTPPIFIGISNTHTKSEFRSVEGTPLSNIQLSWSDQPNFQAEDNCLTMKADGDVAAVSCAENHPFVCYSQKELSCDGQNVFGYACFSEVGSCYKLATDKRTWSEAAESCARDGAHLAVVNSHLEAQVLRNIIISNNADLDSAVHIGFRKNEIGFREWITVQGQLLKNTGYASWLKGEPNNTGGNEDCGSIVVQSSQRDGILNDIPCNHLKNYVCEIEERKVG